MAVYGKSSAYTSVDNLYDSYDCGTNLGYIKYGTSMSVAVNGDNPFVGLSVAPGNTTLRINQVIIDWELSSANAVLPKLDKSYFRPVTSIQNGKTYLLVAPHSSSGYRCPKFKEGQNDITSNFSVQQPTEEGNDVLTMPDATHAWIVRSVGDGYYTLQLSDGKYIQSGSEYVPLKVASYYEAEYSHWKLEQGAEGQIYISPKWSTNYAFRYNIGDSEFVVSDLTAYALPSLYELYTPMEYTYSVYKGDEQIVNETVTDGLPTLAPGTNHIAVLAVDDPGIVPSEISEATNVVLAATDGEAAPHTAHNILLTDKQDYYAPADIQADGVIYSRNNTQGYNSVCLPFDFTAEQVSSLFGEGAKVMLFTGVESVDGNPASLTFTYLGEGENVPAGTPCLVWCDTDTPWSMETSSRTLCGTPLLVKGAGATLVGAFRSAALGTGYYKLNTAGTGFISTAASSTVSPFRFYMQLDAPPAEAPAHTAMPEFAAISEPVQTMANSPARYQSQPLGNYQRGDVDGSGMVDQYDAMLLDKVLLGQVSATTLLTEGGLSDVNQDAEVTIADLAHLINILKGADEAQHDYVDLGLPSGTLWATTNVGATVPQESGLFLSWGELQEKADYLTTTLMDADAAHLTANIIGTKHDAATVHWGHEWQMPSRAQLEELRRECLWTPAVVDGVKGMVVSGKAEGYTDRSIFLPFTGYQHDVSRSLEGSYGFLWAGDEYTDGALARGLGFTDGEQGTFHSFFHRANGRCVRPVRQNSN